MPLRLLLFDFDGLLCDTERAAHRSWDELYHQLVGHGLPDRVWAAMAGRSDGETVALADLSARLGRPVGEPTRAARLRRKRELCAVEPVRPGVTALLDAGRAAGLGLGVVSSSPWRWVEPHLRRLGLGHRFDWLVTGDDTPAHKPAPDLYRLALRRAGVPAADALAFEDSESGVRAAGAAGVYCVAVRNAVGGHADLHAADEVRASLLDVALASYLDRLAETGNR
ncbi:HAD family hydrolase [Micromonospora yangpuensis]|uniref:Haloacid dehalogenase superfamily, subfamily IA, variant 3 with third motif having DD or ED n=1 Tax=Micromonospora yangpuensis TaxID=683228 RepID=A0A1C6V3Q7_9ACTN|nr:HAD-IA family hydrolase [Micromonospora yangpuensis]GGM15092.1 haloacid dehalogenase [Micromonospora yangpuensis]SCL60868.1 haloacid dehalogenase superfamily, subfamily IA, variant 3 with third motif having DD or ED [Micromonospora yangpuensis]